ncbi:hypothetical protein [Flavivirga rizhaonensis]|uniref:Uncharacterized protein n=1 Tax=Flavivirga rizhaonensis TaxID=2559571 RepID=A0A4S1DUW0_9FLAO|nr:hypothetical protein [Flavivirga rizhaonensis]TGV01870.1 hypothetical protein EM932_13620 [Flavivirga rizhaonensis]
MAFNIEPCHISILECVLFTTIQPCEEVKENSREKFNPDWEFKKLEAFNLFEEGFETAMFDDSSWETVSLPHTANMDH